MTLCDHQQMNDSDAEHLAKTLARAGGAKLSRSPGLLKAWLTSRLEPDASVLRELQHELRSLDWVATQRAIGDVARLEPDLLWMIRMRRDMTGGGSRSSSHEDDEANRCASAMFEWPLRALNRRSPAALDAWVFYQTTVSPLVASVGCLAYVAIPLLSALARGAMPFANRSPSAVASAVASAVIYVASVVSALRKAREVAQATRGIGARTKRALAGLRAARRLASDIAPSLERAMRALRAVTPSVPDSDWSNVALGPVEEERESAGHGLFRIETFDANDAEGALAVAASIDVAAAIARLGQGPSLFGWPSYLDAGIPRLRADGLFNPLLDVEIAIPFRGVVLELGKGSSSGSSNHHPCTVLTGPNSAGKTTLMHSIALCVCMAQTIALAPCARGCELTPFASVVGDFSRELPSLVGGSGARPSRFQEEAIRLARVLEQVERCHPSAPCLVVLDEVFSGTNPEEGAAMVSAAISRLSRMPFVASLLSTHFTGGLPDGGVANSTARFICLRGRVDPGTGRGGVDFCREIETGVCRQRFAIELLLREATFAAESRVVEIALDAARILRAEQGAEREEHRRDAHGKDHPPERRRHAPAVDAESEERRRLEHPRDE